MRFMENYIKPCHEQLVVMSFCYTHYSCTFNNRHAFYCLCYCQNPVCPYPLQRILIGLPEILMLFSISAFSLLLFFHMFCLMLCSSYVSVAVVIQRMTLVIFSDAWHYGRVLISASARQICCIFKVEFSCFMYKHHAIPDGKTKL